MLQGDGDGAERLPGGFAVLRAVAAGDFAVDHRRPQIPLGPIVRRFRSGFAQAAQEVLALSQQAVAEADVLRFRRRTPQQPFDAARDPLDRLAELRFAEFFPAIPGLDHLFPEYLPQKQVL